MAEVKEMTDDAQLEQECERDSMIDTITELEKDCDALLQVARMSLEQFEFQYGRRKRGWDAKYLMDRLRETIRQVEGAEEEAIN